MMHGWGIYGGWLGMILGTLIGLAILVGVILLILWLVRRSSGTTSGFYGASLPAQPGAKDILQQRYARGEITREQYREMLAEIDQ